jgi:hypothetical protein
MVLGIGFCYAGGIFCSCSLGARGDLFGGVCVLWQCGRMLERGLLCCHDWLGLMAFFGWECDVWILGRPYVYFAVIVVSIDVGVFGRHALLGCFRWV